MRLTYFEGASEDGRVRSQAFIVLTDRVCLASDLERDFQIRCLGVPRLWHESLFVQKDSFFDGFKQCPFSGRFGNDAAATMPELALLADEYACGKTHGVVLGPEELASELKLLRHRVGSSAETGPTTSAFLAGVLQTVGQSISAISERIPGGDVMAGSGITKELQDLVKSASATKAELASGVSNVRSKQLSDAIEVFLRAVDADSEPRLGRLARAQAYAKDAGHGSEALLMAGIYLLVSSGFGQSRYAAGRVKQPTP